jgi:hypothetical protein
MSDESTLYHSLSIYTPRRVQQSSQSADGTFSFLRFCNLTPSDVDYLAHANEYQRFARYEQDKQWLQMNAYREPEQYVVLRCSESVSE